MAPLSKPNAQAARVLVLQNTPGSDCYATGSFVYRLVEQASFDAESCRALESALLTLVGSPAVAIRTDRHVFAIYRVVALQLLCHLNPTDVCRVDNLDDDAVVDLKNRFDFVVDCYFWRRAYEIGSWWRAWDARGDAHL